MIFEKWAEKQTSLRFAFEAIDSWKLVCFSKNNRYIKIRLISKKTVYDTLSRQY